MYGAIAYITLSVVLIVAIDEARPAWRDAEFELRLKQLQQWQQLAPDRPLVLAVGSSRTQFAIHSPSMGFSDEPGQPLVYNLGYKGGRPNLAALNLIRALDAGVPVRSVLFEFSPLPYASVGMIEGNEVLEFLDHWPTRCSLGDLVRMWELGGSFRGKWDTVAHWLLGYATPWSTRRDMVLGHAMPNWLPQDKLQLVDIYAAPIDNYGFAELTTTKDEKERRLISNEVIKNRGVFAKDLVEFGKIPPLPSSVAAMIDICHARGIPLAFAWIPESPELFAAYPEYAVTAEAHVRELKQKYGLTVFPPPTNLTEGDYIEGVHMLPEGAKKYSRWLAENHLKPWLIELGLFKP